MIPTNRLDILARKLRVGPYARSSEHPKDEEQGIGKDFVVEELGDRFVLKGIPCNGNYHTIAWSNELLDAGQSRTQDGWVEFLKESDWKLPDAPLYHATLAALHQHKDGSQGELVEKVRSMFSKCFQDHWLMTASRVVYEPQGNDVVEHRLSGDENTTTVIVGSDGLVNAQSGFEDSIEALLGVRDLTEVENVYVWVSGKNPYLWRLNTKPRQQVERAVVLGVYGGRFVVGAYVSSDDGRPALGVVYAGAKKSP